MISNENNEKEHSLSVRLTKGTFLAASSVEDGSNLIYYNDQGLLSVRQIIEQGINSPNDKSFWERLQDSLPNDSALGIIVRVIGLATLSLVIILTINVIGTRLKRGYKKKKKRISGFCK